MSVSVTENVTFTVLFDDNRAHVTGAELSVTVPSDENEPAGSYSATHVAVNPAAGIRRPLVPVIVGAVTVTVPLLVPVEPCRL